MTTVEAALPRRWHAEYAWLARTWAQSPASPANGDQDGLARDVLIEAHGDRFTAVTPGTPAAESEAEVPGGGPDVRAPAKQEVHNHA